MTLTLTIELFIGLNLKMTASLTGNRRGFSLPIMWILVAIGLIVFLIWRYGWWWLGILPAVFFVVAIASIVIHRRRDPEREKILRSLRIPLYGLYHIRSIEQSSKGGYLYDIVPEFRYVYSPEEQDEILKSIEAAISETNIDFSEALPSLPFDNDDIRRHLRETLRRLREQEKTIGQ